MKDTLYAIKLTAIICVCYSLVVGFMLLVNKAWNMIGDTNVRNIIACIMLGVVLVSDYYFRRTENGAR